MNTMHNIILAVFNFFRPRWRHSDPWVRLEAVGKLTDRLLLEKLVKYDIDSRVRRSAVLGLGRTHDPTATETLIPLLRERPPSPLLCSAIAALGELGDRRALEPLTEVLAVLPKAASEALLKLDWHPRTDREKAYCAAGREDWKTVVNSGSEGLDAAEAAFKEGELRNYAIAAEAASRMGFVLVFQPACPKCYSPVADEFEFDPGLPRQLAGGSCSHCGEKLHLRLDEGRLEVARVSHRIGEFASQPRILPPCEIRREPRGDVLLRKRIDAGLLLPEEAQVEYYRTLPQQFGHLSTQKLVDCAPRRPDHCVAYLNGICGGAIPPRLDYYRRYLQMEALIELNQVAEAQHYAAMGLLADPDPACAAWGHIHRWFPEYGWEKLTSGGRVDALRVILSRLTP